MGLDELVGDTTPITSRRKVSNRKLEKHEWKWVLIHDPALLDYITRRADESELKMWISFLDEILEEGHSEIVLSQEEREDIEFQRDQLANRI